MQEQKKPSFFGSVRNWCSDHFTQILMGGMFVGGAVAGAILSGDISEKNGYKKGISDFACQVPKLMEFCASNASAYTAEVMYDMAEESGNEDYIRTFENIDYTDIGRKSCRRFYEDEGVKGLLDQMEKAKNGNW